ncbi:MAG: nitrous oxide reductase accessory protein NosL [Phaeodactylibacter sp.]|nr:nitrous oxide reductase accessory protein NosL [Phaeodactylibacter sp.]
MSRQHAAEAVTSKGKVYKFDATECLVHFLKEQNGTEYAYLLASDYERPGTLMPAESSTYLISPQMPSPMGAFLSAFSSPERAQAFQQEKGGEVLSWQQLQERLRE